MAMASSLPSANKDTPDHYYSKALTDDVLIRSTVYPDLENGILTQKDGDNRTVVYLDWFNG